MTRRYAVLERDDDCSEDASTELTGLREEEPVGSSRATRPKGMGERHVIMVCFFFGGLILYAQRAGMAVGIVRMQAIFGWGKGQQGMLLSAFFLGATERLCISYMSPRICQCEAHAASHGRPHYPTHLHTVASAVACPLIAS